MYSQGLDKGAPKVTTYFASAMKFIASLLLSPKSKLTTDKLQINQYLSNTLPDPGIKPRTSNS